MIRRSVQKLLSVLLLVLLGVLPLTLAQDDDSAPPFDLDRVRRATVFIMQVRDVAGQPQITCVGSGTIVSRDGLVLTNAHSSVTSTDCPGDRLVIALNTTDDAPPIAAYQADILQYDAGVDLALLRIARGFDGRPIARADLSLPFVELADSTRIRLDETITVVGYPETSNESVRVVSASIQGFSSEPSAGDRSWIKIRPDAAAGLTVTGLMSGGGAYNRDGQLIGIPTTAPLGRQTGTVTCQRLQDTNADGLININDFCVPVGGSINVLRPSNFARTLLRGASLGLSVEKVTDRARLALPVGQPTISTPFFAASISGDMPTSVVNNALPSGIDSLYLFFNYANMTPETVYEVRVSINGNVNPVFSLTPVRWSGGERGLWYFGNTGQVWPNGEYEFTVFINGVAASEPRFIRIGGTTEPDPTFSSITFGLMEGNQMFSSGPVLGTGNTVRAQFIYNNMLPDINWSAIWYFNGAEIQRSTDVWGQARGGNGTENIGITVDTGLPPGQYRLELYIDTRLAAMADFTVAGARDASLPLPRVFNRDRMRFVVASTDTEAINARPVTTFTNPVSVLYTVFDWEQIAPGTLWRMRLTVDDTPFYDQIVPWSNTDTGANYLTRIAGERGVPDGTYAQELYVNNVLLGRIEVDIGIGQLPIDPFASPDGVQVNGRILDAASGLGIPDVTFIVISEDFSVGDYTAEIQQIYAMATTDRNGNFVLDRPLRFDAPYSIWITAYGYLPITADGVTVTPETDNPLALRIFMTPD